MGTPFDGKHNKHAYKPTLVWTWPAHSNSRTVKDVKFVPLMFVTPGFGSQLPLFRAIFHFLGTQIQGYKPYKGTKENYLKQSRSRAMSPELLKPTSIPKWVEDGRIIAQIFKKAFSSTYYGGLGKLKTHSVNPHKPLNLLGFRA